MAKANRICYTDNKPYYYCPSCPSEEKKETFYNMFCCERCSKIFKLLSDENFKHISTEQCKKELLALGVTTEEIFKDGIMVHIKKVLNYEPVVENESVESDINEDTEKKISYAPKKSRKIEIVK